MPRGLAASLVRCQHVIACALMALVVVAACRNRPGFRAADQPVRPATAGNARGWPMAGSKVGLRALASPQRRPCTLVVDLTFWCGPDTTWDNAPLRWHGLVAADMIRHYNSAPHKH
jgi:hypothetical protein